MFDLGDKYSTGACSLCFKFYDYSALFHKCFGSTFLEVMLNIKPLPSGVVFKCSRVQFDILAVIVVISEQSASVQDMPRNLSKEY